MNKELLNQPITGLGPIGAELEKHRRALLALWPSETPSVRPEVRPDGTRLHAKSGGAASPPRQEWFQVAEVLNDYLLCYPANAALLAEFGAPENGFILVAKPKLLRTGLLAAGAKTHGGYTYERAPSPFDAQQFRQRITGDAAHPDVEQIYPPYDVVTNDWWIGDLILALEIRQTLTAWSYVSNNKLLAMGLLTPEEIIPTLLPEQVFPAGTEVHWLDLNQDGRHWASTGLLTGSRVATDGTTTLPVVGWHP